MLVAPLYLWHFQQPIIYLSPLTENEINIRVNIKFIYINIKNKTKLDFLSFLNIYRLDLFKFYVISQFQTHSTCNFCRRITFGEKYVWARGVCQSSIRIQNTYIHVWYIRRYLWKFSLKIKCIRGGGGEKSVCNQAFNGGMGILLYTLYFSAILSSQ